MECSRLFEGTHNFRNFSRRTNRNPMRRIDSIEITTGRRFIVIDIKGESFLWHMVRKIVNAIQKVGVHEIDINSVQDAINNPEKKYNFGIASPEYLILMNVSYDFPFETRIPHDLKDLINLSNIKYEFFMELARRIQSPSTRGAKRYIT
jgi:tRNA U38,U39,U40 pseudouridine synthase TruA